MIDIDQNETLVLAVVMPVYNQEDTIGNVIEEWVDALASAHRSCSTSTTTAPPMERALSWID